MSLSALPLPDRPRERLLRYGPNALGDAELIAILLGTGPPDGDGALSPARALVARFPDLRRMAAAGVAELSSVRGIGLVQACRLKAALSLAMRLSERPIMRGQPLTNAQEVYHHLGRPLALLDHEVFLAVPLDTKNRVLARIEVARGGSCSVVILPRDLLTAVLREGAASVVLVHNHPSGDPDPSEADRDLTEQLIAAGALVGIRVIDHIIVAQGGFYSFAQKERHAPKCGQGRGVR